MIVLKLETTDFFGTAVATCMAFMFDSWINHSGDVRVVVEGGFREVLTAFREGEEYELELSKMPHVEVTDWVSRTLRVLRDD